MRRITKAALGGLAGCALVLGGTQLAGAASSGTFKFTEALIDLLTNEDDGPFDSARAKTTIAKTADGGTTFTIRVTGVHRSVAGQEFGAHLHVGPCDNPPGTGGHYKNDRAVLEAIRANEVWFDLVPNADGMALAETTVPFVPVDDDLAFEPGKMSIVIHKGIASLPTSQSPKQACFPLELPQWAPALETP